VKKRQPAKDITPKIKWRKLSGTNWQGAVKQKTCKTRARCTTVFSLQLQTQWNASY